MRLTIVESLDHHYYHLLLEYVGVEHPMAMAARYQLLSVGIFLQSCWDRRSPHHPANSPCKQTYKRLLVYAYHFQDIQHLLDLSFHSFKLWAHACACTTEVDCVFKTHSCIWIRYQFELYRLLTFSYACFFQL